MYSRKRKSNRAQADYFELLVCQYICHLSRIRFAYSKNLAELSNKILALPNGKERLQLQNDNLLKLSTPLKHIIDFEVSRKGKIVEVVWIGRKLILKTTSDVDAEHVTHRFTKFSIKSISKLGFGTIKNLGMRSIKKYLKVDFSKQYIEMWDNLREFTKQWEIPRVELRKKILKKKEWFEWATRNGRKYQTELNNLCLQSFNKLSLSEKVDLLNFILDAHDPDLYVVITNSKGVLIYKPIEERLNNPQNIKAKKDSFVGYTIYINNIPTYRVQTNNTNGIGISSFCQRVFFVEPNFDYA